MSQRIESTGMKSISSFIDTSLQWVQPSAFKPMYELRSGDECILTLRFPKWFSTTVRVEAAEGRWEIKRVGFWKQRIEIQREGDHLPFATCTMQGWTNNKGTVELPKGRRVSITANCWTSRYDVATPTGEPMMVLKCKIGLKPHAELTLHPKGTSYPELPWIAALVWYLVLLARRRAAHAG
jgi:hypothetical protein